MNIAVILSGGVGSRMGADIPKQYMIVNGQPIISYCLQTLFENENTDAIVIVVSDSWRAFVEEYILRMAPHKPYYFATSGETRQYSIYNALKKIKEYGFSDDDTVLIHDAARPLVSQELINRCYTLCQYSDGVMPVIPLSDTVYFSRDGKHIQSLIDRGCLWRGQSPEAFRFGKYYQLHEQITKDEMLKINGSTEIAFKYGLDCQMIDGDVMNFKITTKEDLSTLIAIIAERK